MIDFKKLEKLKDIIDAIKMKNYDLTFLSPCKLELSVRLTEEHKEFIKCEIIRLLNEEIADLYKEFEKEVQNEA